MTQKIRRLGPGELVDDEGNKRVAPWASATEGEGAVATAVVVEPEAGPSAPEEPNDNETEFDPLPQVPTKDQAAEAALILDPVSTVALESMEEGTGEANIELVELPGPASGSRPGPLYIVVSDIPVL